jgi:twitching motility two-component system response regulator PilG
MFNASHSLPHNAVTASDSHSQPPSLRSPSPIASPLKVLQNIARQGRSGRLTIQQIAEDPIILQVHTGKGQLHFANSSIGQQQWLAYVLRRINSPLLNDVAPYFAGTDYSKSAYEFLCQAWQMKSLSLQRLRSLLRLLSQEALVHIIAIPQAKLLFDRSVGLDPILLSEPFRDLVTPIMSQVVGWQRLNPYIISPFQRLQLIDSKQFVKQFESKMRSLQGPKVQVTPMEALEDRPCLYEVAFYLNADLLQLATTVAGAVRTGIMTTRPFTDSNCRPTIACIDDSSTVQRNVKLILESAGYQVLSLTDPLTTLSTLVREKPVLVLMDITMPNLDGYELCRMLRQCSALRGTPIVMLTGRDGLIDKMRARLVGASDYITKPFNAKTLTDVVTRFVQTELVSTEAKLP